MEREAKVLTRDGLTLHTREWMPERALAALVLVHGLAEHSGRHRETAVHFAGRGYAVFAFDHRGHGRSPGPRVHVGSFQEFRWDLAAAIANAHERCPDLPVFLLGHSHGGLVVLHHAIDAPQGLAGAVVTSPLLGVHPESAPSPALALVARALSVVWPSLLLPNPIDLAKLSRDPAVGAAYAADPLVSHAVSPRWFTSVRAAMVHVHEGGARLALPTMLLSASADRLVDPEAAARFAQRTPAGVLEFVRWEGLRHEMLNEPERVQVRARIEGWLRERLPRP